MTAARRKTTEPEQASMPLPVEEGCHLHMPESVYFGAGALGSSDLKMLYWDAPSWWASSRFNLERREPERITRSVAKNLGTGLHALVIEGEDAYTSKFVVEPDAASNRYAKTRKAMIDLLAEKGIRVPRGEFDNSKIYAAIRREGLTHLVWHTAYADYEKAKNEGREHITNDEDRRLRFTAHLIKTHPQVGPAFKGGLGEVSIFWRRPEDPDTLLRARIDYLRVRRMLDLKTVGNWRGKDIDGAIRQAIEDFDYDIQRRLYPEAFDQLVKFVDRGKVFAWDETGIGRNVVKDERELLTRIAAGGMPEWVWVFVQLRVDDIGRERAAIVAPRFHLAEGRIWDQAGEKIEAGLRAYRAFRKEIGLHRPWSVVEETKQLVDEDIRTRTKKEMV